MQGFVGGREAQIAGSQRERPTLPVRDTSARTRHHRDKGAIVVGIEPPSMLMSMLPSATRP